MGSLGNAVIPAPLARLLLHTPNPAKDIADVRQVEWQFACVRAFQDYEIVWFLRRTLTAEDLAFEQATGNEAIGRVEEIGFPILLDDPSPTGEQEALPQEF